MLVLDDVSELDDLFTWIRAALAPGCRILMITTSKTLAYYWKVRFPHGNSFSLGVLSPQDSENFLKKKVFGGEDYPETLRTTLEEIARNCGGLPLVIDKIGELLATSYISEWTRVARGIDTYFEQSSLFSRNRAELFSEYYELPDYLQPCLLYLTMFPIGMEVNCKRLVRLWMGEGFIQDGEDGDSLEETRSKYITKLIDRELVHSAEVDQTTGMIKICRISDIHHHMMLSMLESSAFCKILPERSKEVAYAADCTYTRVSHRRSSTIRFDQYKRYNGSFCIS